MPLLILLIKLWIKLFSNKKKDLLSSKMVIILWHLMDVQIIEGLAWWIGSDTLKPIHRLEKINEAWRGSTLMFKKLNFT